MKPVTAVTWDEHNHRHLVLERGRCSVRDVEDILLARCHPTRRLGPHAHIRAGKPEVRRLYHGRSCRGRPLVVVAVDEPGGCVRPVTCWPLARGHLRRYVGWAASQPR